MKGNRPWMIGGLVLALAAGGFFLWRHFSTRESTDDAQVSGHVSPVATRVAGTIIAVHVNDNEPVKVGDVLVEIDPHDYQIAVSRAEADLAAAEAAGERRPVDGARDVGDDLEPGRCRADRDDQCRGGAARPPSGRPTRRARSSTSRRQSSPR